MKPIKYCISIATLFFYYCSFASDVNTIFCSDIYIAKSAKILKKSARLRSENLINYLQMLLSVQQISIQSLQQMLTSAESGKFINPITEKQAFASSTKRIAYNAIQDILNKIYLDKTYLDQDRFLSLLR